MADTTSAPGANCENGLSHPRMPGFAGEVVVFKAIFLLNILWLDHVKKLLLLAGEIRCHPIQPCSSPSFIYIFSSPSGHPKMTVGKPPFRIPAFSPKAPTVWNGMTPKGAPKPMMSLGLDGNTQKRGGFLTSFSGHGGSAGSSKPWLIGGLEYCLFSPIVGMMIQSDFHIFRGVYIYIYTTNQMAFVGKYCFRMIWRMTWRGLAMSDTSIWSRFCAKWF